MKRITVEEYRTRFPKWNNDYFENLSSEQQEMYVEQYNVYSHFLTEFFIKHYSLDEYDKALLNSPYSFPFVDEEEMDIYQYLASDRLNYLYIRNNLCIEKLSIDELSFLSLKAQDDDPLYDEEVDKFIETTFKKVMVEDGKNDFFGPESGEYLCDENTIVLGVRYDDYQLLPGQSEDDWMLDNSNRLQDYEMLASIVDVRLSKACGCPVKTIRYNEFSTIKKDSSIEVNENEKHDVL